MRRARKITTLFLLAAHGASAYSLLRKPDTGPNNKGGFACIPVPVARLVAPGERATMHFFDTSTLRAVRHAQTFGNSTLGQVVIDQAAMRERKFRVHPIGSAYKILSVKPSTHTDKFGGSSNSLMAEVIGTGTIEIAEVVEKMPFMTVQISTEQPPRAEDVSVADYLQDLEVEVSDAARVCADLEHITSFKGERTRLTEQQSGSWSLQECVERVLELRDEDSCARNRLRLTALASTVFLPGELKLEAMERAQQNDIAALAAFVGDALREEGRRRLALKALSGLSESGADDGQS